ncbi:MAG: hypothetical protein MAG431_00352 [Chloroflexi bacterium]|nr:hypothetical protein [Chloroflexota bacterium]
MNYPAIVASKYTSYSGNAGLVFEANCKTLTGRAWQVDWPTFTGDDWYLLRVMAKTEGVAPLLYRALERSNPDTLNGLTFQALRGEYYATAAYNTLLFEELARILTALEAAEIPVLLLKGAALAQTIYSDPALRPMSDLDVLVPFKEIDPAVRTVKTLGYRSDVASLWPCLERVLGHHDHLRNPHGVNLELHWSLTQAFNRDHTLTDWFWQHTKPLPALSRDNPLQPSQARTVLPAECSGAQALSPTAHLLFLSAHLFLQHGAARGILLWLYDLHLMLITYPKEIDWEALLEQSRRLGWGPPLVTALAQLRETFRTDFPPQILDTFQPLRDAPSQEWVKEKSQPNQSRAWTLWQKWRTLPWPGRAVYGLGNIFPSPAFMRKRYDPRPAWLWPFYYFYRWGDMLAEVARYFFG